MDLLTLIYSTGQIKLVIVNLEHTQMTSHQTEL